MTCDPDFDPSVAVKRGNRMSSLPVVQFCPQAARLGAQYGSGRAAAMSRYFHAKCAGVECKDVVTAEEAEAIDEWQTPTDVTLWNGEVLTYEESERELHVGLDASGQYCDPTSEFGSEHVVCEGHLDFAWRITVAKNASCPTEHVVAYVADIKKSKWTTLDGPESLQLMAYAVAFALRVGATFFCTGIFVAETGEWQWLNRMIAVDSDEFRDIQARVMAAATNTEGQACTGGHCRDCYARLHCPEHLLATTAAIGWLAPVAEGNTVITGDSVAKLIFAAQSVKELSDKALDLAKEFARRGNLVSDPETGKVYKAITCKGREGVSVKALREKMGEAANDYIERGKAFDMFRWVKP